MWRTGLSGRDEEEEEDSRTRARELKDLCGRRPIFVLIIIVLWMAIYFWTHHTGSLLLSQMHFMFTENRLMPQTLGSEISVTK